MGVCGIGNPSGSRRVADNDGSSGVPDGVPGIVSSIDSDELEHGKLGYIRMPTWSTPLHPASSHVFRLIGGGVGYRVFWSAIRCMPWSKSGASDGLGGSSRSSEFDETGVGEPEGPLIHSSSPMPNAVPSATGSFRFFSGSFL